LGRLFIVNIYFHLFSVDLFEERDREPLLLNNIEKEEKKSVIVLSRRDINNKITKERMNKK
jgi:hypothetical protein